MPRRSPLTIQQVRHLLDQRAGYRISAEWGHVGVLEGGGHICELSLNRVPGVNPLWKPPWTTIDPHLYEPGRHRRRYGPPPDGPLLAGIAGHSLSFDHFGPPSKEETGAGLSTHGEAPAAKWKRLARPVSAHATLNFGCALREAQIAFRRTITVDPVHPITYCEETATNLARYDRLLSWNEHVTFGPPFLECGTTIFDMPATRAKVCPASYSKQMFLQPDAEFLWPNAPADDGSPRNLRTTPEAQFGHYTAQLLDPSLELAFISACNPRQRLLVVYVFRREDFPWVGNWEERFMRTAAPWNQKTFCRGMEFSTTPFAILRRETVDQGPLFGAPTYRWLPAKSTLAVRYVILLLQVPEAFAGVQQVSVADGAARIVESAPGGRILTIPVRNFL